MILKKKENFYFRCIIFVNTQIVPNNIESDDNQITIYAKLI